MSAAVGAPGGRLYSLACFVHTVELLPTADGDKENVGAGGVAYAVGCVRTSRCAVLRRRRRVVLRPGQPPPPHPPPQPPLPAAWTGGGSQKPFSLALKPLRSFQFLDYPVLVVHAKGGAEPGGGGSGSGGSAAAAGVGLEAFVALCGRLYP